MGLTPATAPLQNAVVHASDSSISFDVRNTLAGRNLRQLDFTLPTNYTARGGVGPAGWTVSVQGSRRIRFQQTDCAQPGLTSTAPGTFRLDVTAPSDRLASDTQDTMPYVGPSDPCTGFQGWTVPTTIRFPRVVLRVTGTATPANAFAAPATATIVWTVRNMSSQTKTGLTGARTISPASGWGNEVCWGTVPASLAAGASASVTCTYSLTAAGTYTFSANASGSPSATGAGASVSVRVGAPRVTWARPYLVRGRAPYSLSFTVVNDSGVGLSQFTVSRPSPSWTGMSSTTTGATCSAIAGTCTYGALAAGATATVNVTFSGVPSPTATTTYGFNVQLTPTTGAPVTFPQGVTVVVPLPDVGRLTIQSDANGQTLAWTNTDGSGTPHDGVVVLRTPAGTVPPLPTDFVDYTTLPRPAEVFYADGGRSTVNTVADPLVGAYWYRVCNRDAYLVYSGCRTGFWNDAGYLDSAIAPTGGWTHQLGGFAALVPGIVPGNRVGVATNRLEVDVLDLPTGHRSFDPAPLVSLPSSSTPATRLADGRLLLFAADASGTVTAVDLGTGLQAWRTTFSGESFVAGVSGITRAYGAPAFQAAYPMDVLLLASAAATGHVIAVDARSGTRLWTITTGSPLRAPLVYDAGVNRFYVPTSSAGVLAYDMAASTPTVAAVPATGWQNPGGRYTLYCLRTFEADSLGCIDTTGQLRVLDRLSGAVRAQLSTGLSSPTTLARVGGATPGFVVGDARSLQRIVASGTPLTLRSAGTFTANGYTLGASAVVFSADGFVIVGGSDLRLHKLSLADATELGTSPAVTSARAGASLGPVAYDSTDRLFVVGTTEGRVSALPRF